MIFVSISVLTLNANERFVYKDYDEQTKSFKSIKKQKVENSSGTCFSISNKYLESIYSKNDDTSIKSRFGTDECKLNFESEKFCDYKMTKRGLRTITKDCKPVNYKVLELFQDDFREKKYKEKFFLVETIKQAF